MMNELALMEEAQKVAASLFGLDRPVISRLLGGRVNESFLAVSEQGRFVLQRINDFFQSPAPVLNLPERYQAAATFSADTTVGDNWRSVFQAVAERSGLSRVPMPGIYPDLTGRWLASFPVDPKVSDSGSWRLTAFVEGRPAPKEPAGAREASRLLGFFHRQLNLPLPLELKPLPDGDFTNQHLTTPRELERIYDDYRGHPQLDDIKPLIKRAAEATGGFLARPDFLAVFTLREVIIHGDPKADNFLFSPDGRALALLDWDSVGLGHVLIDLAELLRSWAAFDEAGRPDVDCLAAAVEGYAESGLELSSDEVEMLPAVLRAIALNLSRRYLVDALAQVYFRWDRRSYPSLFDQNRTRAEAMLTVAEQLMNLEITLGRRLLESYRRGVESSLIHDGLPSVRMPI